MLSPLFCQHKSDVSLVLRVARKAKLMQFR